MMNTDTIKYCIPASIQSGIYKIISPCGHYYIGSTKNFKKRYRTHLKKLLTGTHANKYMQNVFLKFPGLLKFILVEEVNSEDKILQIEQSYIDKNYNNKLCMNICSTVVNPPKCKGHSLETILKMQKPKSLEHSKNISLAKTGIKINSHSPEALLRKSLRHKGIPWSKARREAEIARKNAGIVSKLKNRPWSEARRRSQHLKQLTAKTVFADTGPMTR